MNELCDDLEAEHEALDVVLAAIEDWDIATPAQGWSVRDSVSHLWFFDQRARLAIADPEGFAADMAVLLERGIEASVEPGKGLAPDDLHERWRQDRAALLEVARALDPEARVPWYGPSMGARSFVTARLMETWAHGQDIVDVAPIDRPATSRLRHIAHIGVRARPYSYAVNGLDLPATEVAVVLEGPDGDRWVWGDEQAPARVMGAAIDFCLVVTQRRHLDDVELEIDGEAAREWMRIAQAFAGPAGTGRAPLDRS
jgi:uncharacterized protein (TIGR03084 family)